MTTAMQNNNIKKHKIKSGVSVTQQESGYLRFVSGRLLISKNISDCFFTIPFLHLSDTSAISM